MLREEDTAIIGDRLPDVRKAIHHLTHRQFFCIAAERASAVRRVLENPALRTIVARHFDFAGYDLEFNESEGWYGVIPRIEEVTTPKMSPTQTLVLLCLALHWTRCMERGDLDLWANAITTLNELWLDIEDRLVRGQGPVIKVERVLEMLKGEFSHKSIVNVGEFDAESDDYGISIRPFVRLLAGEDTLVRINRFLNIADAEARRSQAEAYREWGEATAATADEGG
ncbi:DUF4194 domain-containing protein [Microvirga massiliensis]|uniref:DUF4194 domain-containing protein n=1 Tax=Microvirga massiliensis TaxID=1033741 RepID=UPI00062BB0B8|nr:DUF4194 domain-containing protein [Microvirga massiliensis]